MDFQIYDIGRLQVCKKPLFLQYVVLFLWKCQSCVSGFANLFALTLIADQWSGIHCNTSCCIWYTWWFVCRCACSKCLFAISQGRCISLFKQPPWSGSMGDLGLACCMLEHKAIQGDTYQFLFPVPTCLRCVSNTFEYINLGLKIGWFLDARQFTNFVENSIIC